MTGTAWPSPEFFGDVAATVWMEAGGRNMQMPDNKVRLVYEREESDAIVVRQLPFVVAVLGDFTGMPEEPLPRLRDRRFVHVFPENLDSVLAGMRPHLSLKVEDALSEDYNATALKVDLTFRRMDDFQPEQIALQIHPTRALLDLREK